MGIWAALRTWIDASEELHGLARSAVGALLWAVFLAVMLAPFVVVYTCGRASG